MEPAENDIKKFQAGHVVYFAEIKKGGTTVGDVKTVGAEGENGWRALYNTERHEAEGLTTDLDHAIAYLVVNGVIPRQFGPAIERRGMDYLMEYVEKAR